MKKGFTLIEMVSVVVILVIIATMITPNMMRLSKERKQQLYESKVQYIESNATSWGVANIERLSDSCTCVTVETLIKGAYIIGDNTERNTVFDPRYNSSMNDLKVCVTYDYVTDRIYTDMIERGESDAICNETSTYTVTYIAYTGSTTTQNISTRKTTFTIPRTSPTREGYKFLGWSKTSGALVAGYKPGDTLTISGNMTLYGVWEDKNAIYLTLNGSGEQRFLGSNFEDLPSEVYVDGVSITPATSYTFNNGGEHKVVLKWNHQVTSMNYMFYGCSGLTSVDLSNFDTTGVTSMNYVFGGCSGLTSVDLSNFDTTGVTSMKFMFYGCSGLTSLDLSSFDTTDVMEMNNMFYGCSGLTSLDLSNFDTTGVLDMNRMFYGCSGLTSLDLSNFDTTGVAFINSMFSGCSSLTSIKTCDNKIRTTYPDYTYVCNN